MKRVLTTAALLLGGCLNKVEYRPLVSPGETAAVLVFQDVRVFPATSTGTLEHQDVVVRGDRIESIAATGGAHPSGARVIDGRGKTLLPGLVDMHAHVTLTAAPPWFKTMPDLEHNLQAHLYAGVTTVHDTGGRLQDVLSVRTRTALGPRVLVAGPILTARGGYPTSYVARLFPWPLDAAIINRLTIQVATEDEGRSAVRKLAKAGVDMIKVVLADTPEGTPHLHGGVLDAIVTEAHALGRKVVAHVDNAANAKEAARAGVDALVHGVHSSPLTEADAAEIAKRGLSAAPTLLTFERLDQLAHETFAATPMEKETEPAALLEQFSREKAGDFRPHPDLEKWLTLLTTHKEDRLVNNTKRMHGAGIPILVGTDGNGSIASFPGGIHEEMRLLHAAGVPNADVLLGATSRPARVIRPDADYGTIEPGKCADLLLVEGDPLADLAAMEKISLVVRGGRVVERHPAR